MTQKISPELQAQLSPFLRYALKKALHDYMLFTSFRPRPEVKEFKDHQTGCKYSVSLIIHLVKMLDKLPPEIRAQHDDINILLEAAMKQVEEFRYSK